MPNAQTIVDTPAILRDGEYFILDDYALRQELYPKVVRTFLDGIEKFAGHEARQKVEAAGLSRMHDHFPVAKLLLLEAYLNEHLQQDLYYWSYRIGRENLGLTERFYVDHLIVMRIHYPFLVAREAKNIEQPPYPIKAKARLGFAALKNWPLLANAVANGWRRRKEKSAYRPEAYHQLLPEPARAHGAHIDTWYGHSYDGINLWWSIDGVNVDNTVILYPGMFGYQYPFDPVSMYLAEGVPVTEPHKIAMKPGQLLVFNPELLHGTQINVSDQTRVAITTRLNPGRPRFDLNAAWNFEHWYSSDDLERRRFTSVTVFPANDNRGKPSYQPRSGTAAPTTRMIKIAGSLGSGQEHPVCRSDDLADGEKTAVDFDDTKAVVLRTGGQLRAIDRICPHLSFDMIGAYHDETTIYCPGHGVAYSLADGTSACQAFSLSTFECSERDGTVYLRRAAPRP